MRTILIPTDFSENAGDALAYALALIGNSNAKLHIINVVDPNLPAAEPLPGKNLPFEEELQNARSAMEALYKFSTLPSSGVDRSHIQITTEVVVGTVAASLKAEAKAVGADLIIMGTQGTRHSFVQKTLGTISTSAIRDAPCPVILVPRGYEYQPIKTVLFCTNLNHGDPYELWRATELLQPHVAVVRCLHVLKNAADKNDAQLETFAKYMVEHSPSIQTIFNIEVNKDTEAAIAEYADTYDVELVIMHRTQQPFWNRLLEPSYTKKMASLLEIPLMVMNS